MAILMTLLYGGTIHPESNSKPGTSSWGYYGNSNPSNWHETFPKCNGQRQSPININIDEVQPVHWLKPFVFYNYPSNSANQKAATLVNNGHTASLALASQWLIDGGNLKGRYQAAEIHFHWGTTDESGAEHSINGIRHAMEIQMIFFATKYGNMTNAMKYPDGLANIAVFADVSSEDNPIFENLIGKLATVSDYGATSDLSSFRLTDFLPLDPQGYYHYMGSLTGPPCHESVMWFVMQDRITMSSRQIDAFRSLQTAVTINGNAEFIEENIRPVQSHVGRTVFSSKESMPVQHSIKKRQATLSGASKHTFRLSGKIQRGPFSFNRGRTVSRIAPAIQDPDLPISNFFGRKKSVSSMNTQVQPIGNINQKSSNNIIQSSGSGAQAWKSPPSSSGTASKSSWAWPGTQGSGSWSQTNPKVPPPPPTELSQTTTTVDNFILQFKSGSKGNNANKIVGSADLINNVQFGSVHGISIRPPTDPASGNSISNTPKVGATPSEPNMQFVHDPAVTVTKIGRTETVAPLTRPTTAGVNPTTPPTTLPPVQTTLPLATSDPALAMSSRYPSQFATHVPSGQQVAGQTTVPPSGAHAHSPPQQQPPLWSAPEKQPTSGPPNNPVRETTVPPQTTAQSPQPATRPWQKQVTEAVAQEVPQQTWQSGHSQQNKANAWGSSGGSRSSWTSGGSQISGTVSSRRAMNGWRSGFRQAPVLTQKTPTNQEWFPISPSPNNNGRGGVADNSATRGAQTSRNSGQNWQSNQAQQQPQNQPQVQPAHRKQQTHTQPQTQPNQQPQNVRNSWAGQQQAKTPPQATPVAYQQSPTPSGMPNNSTMEDAVGWFVEQLKNGTFQAKYRELWNLLDSAMTQYKKNTAQSGMEQKISELNAKLKKLGGQLRNSVTQPPPTPQTFNQHRNGGQQQYVPSPEQQQMSRQFANSGSQNTQQFHAGAPQRSAHRKHDPPRSRYNQEVKSVNSINKIEKGNNGPSLGNFHGKNSAGTITVPQDITVFTPVNGGNPAATPIPDQQPTLASSMNNPPEQQVSRNAEFNVQQPNQVQQQGHIYEPNPPVSEPFSTAYELLTTTTPPVTTTVKVVRKKPTFSLGNTKPSHRFKISGGSRFSARSFSARKSVSSPSSSFSTKKRTGQWKDPAAKLKVKLQQQQRQQQERNHQEQLRIQRERQIQEQQRQEQLALEQQRQEQIALEQQRQEQMLLEQQRQEQMLLEQQRQEQLALEQQRQEQLALEQQRQEQLALEQQRQEMLMEQQRLVEQQRQEQIRLEQERQQQQQQEQMRLQEQQRIQEQMMARSQNPSQNYPGQQQQMFNPTNSPFNPQQQPFQEPHNPMQQHLAEVAHQQQHAHQQQPQHPHQQQPLPTQPTPQQQHQSQHQGHQQPAKQPYNPLASFEIQRPQHQSHQNQPQQHNQAQQTHYMPTPGTTPNQQFGTVGGGNIPPSGHGSALDQALGLNPRQPNANANANNVMPNKGPEVASFGHQQPRVNAWAPPAWVDPTPSAPPPQAGHHGQGAAGNTAMQQQHSAFNPFGAQNPFQQPEQPPVPRHEFMAAPTKVAKAPGFRRGPGGRLRSTASVMQANHQQMHANAFARQPPTTVPPTTQPAGNFWNQPLVTQRIPTPAAVTQMPFKPTTYPPPAVTQAPVPASRWSPIAPKTLPPRAPTVPSTQLTKPVTSQQPKPKPKPNRRKQKARRNKKNRIGLSKLLLGYGRSLRVHG